MHPCHFADLYQRLSFRTRIAILLHEKGQGLDTALLSNASARKLGLAPGKRDQR